jgi:iron complex outermembrane receptor protein
MTTPIAALGIPRSRHRGRRLPAVLTTLAAGLLAPLPAPVALAQEPGAGHLEEIVVTARRREESLLDLSTSVSVFTQERLLQNGIDSLNEYFLKTPNVAVHETGTRSENFIAMRGISNIGQGANSSFAFYIDEFAVQTITSNPHLQDIERIEVLRGPQGTFYGRNAAGGAINVSTHRPGPEFEANGFFGYGRFDSWEVSGTVNVPVAPDKLFLRGVAYYSDSDGVIDNVNPAGGTDSQEYLNGRIAARLLATERLTVDLSYMRTDEKSGLETLVPTHVLSFGTINLIGPFPITDGLEPYPENETDVNNNNPKRVDYDFNIVNGRVEYVADNFSITSITGYADGGRKQNGDVDAMSLDAINLTRDSRPDLFSQELRIASVGKGRFDWVVGGLYADADFEVDLEVVTGTDIQIFFGPFIPPGFAVRTLMEQNETESWAGFGEIDWHATDRLTLTYGGRYTDDKVSQAQDGTNFGFPAPPVSESQSFSEYTSRFAATFDLTEDVALYAVASQGYRTGGVQLDPALEEDSFDPETLWNYEGGIRGTVFDNRLWFSTSVFHIDWSDLQVRTLVNQFVGGIFILVQGTDNAAEASSTGVELEMRARPIEQLELGFAGGWLDAEFDDYPDAIVGGIPIPIDLSGERLLNSPEWTLSADAQYDFKLGAFDAFVRGEWSYRDKTVTDLISYFPQALIPPGFGLQNQFPYRVPAFDVWNFRAGIEHGRFSLTAYVENAFDENYYTGTYDDLFWSGVHVRVHPRTFGFRISARY